MQVYKIATAQGSCAGLKFSALFFRSITTHTITPPRRFVVSEVTAAPEAPVLDEILHSVILHARGLTLQDDNAGITPALGNLCQLPCL